MRTYKLVGDPPPPVSQRPQCPYCNKPLRPFFVHHWDWQSDSNGTKEWTGDYEGYGYFCTLRCGTAYANNVVYQAKIRGET